jgi:hypothetical protein
MLLGFCGLGFAFRHSARKRLPIFLNWSRLHGLSQDEEERGGVVNRGARDECT